MTAHSHLKEDNSLTQLLEATATGLEAVAQITVPTVEQLDGCHIDFLLNLRQALSLIGVNTSDGNWPVLVAIDASVVRYAERKPSNSGSSGAQLWARANRLSKIARRVNIRPGLFLKNELIYKLYSYAQNSFIAGPTEFLTLSSILTLYSEYEKAIHCAAPFVAIRQMAYSKLEGTEWDPAKVERSTGRLDKSKTPVEIKCEECLLLNHLKETLRIFDTQIKTDCPNPKWFSRLYSDWLEDLNDTMTDLSKHRH